MPKNNRQSSNKNQNNNQNKNQSNQIKPTKKRFDLEEHETVDACLDRIKKAGYLPVRRSEKPVFRLTEQAGEEQFEPVGRQISFDAVLAKDER